MLQRSRTGLDAPDRMIKTEIPTIFRRQADHKTLRHGKVRRHQQIMRGEQTLLVLVRQSRIQRRGAKGKQSFISIVHKVMLKHVLMRSKKRRVLVCVSPCVTAAACLYIQPRL